MSREIPTLNEMLKLYSKKDLWDRIQEKNKLLDQRNHELAVMKKALELAVETLRYEWGRDAIKELYKQAIENLEDGNLGFDTKMAEWFEEQAKEMLKDDN